MHLFAWDLEDSEESKGCGKRQRTLNKKQAAYVVLGSRLNSAVKEILKFLSLISSTTHLGKKERSTQKETICIASGSHILSSLGKHSLMMNG